MRPSRTTGENALDIPPSPTVSMCAFSIRLRPPPLPRRTPTTDGRPGTGSTTVTSSPAAESHDATNEAIRPSPEPDGTRSGFTDSIATSEQISSWSSSRDWSDTEDSVQRLAVPRPRRRHHLDDAPLLDERGPVRHAERHLVVLLGQQDRYARRLQSPEERSDRLHQHRREAFRRFVQQHHARVAHQGAPDRQHLALAARQAARQVVLQRFELGEQLPDPLLGPAPAAAVRVRSDVQVLVHGKVLEALRPGGHVRETPPRPAVGRPPAHVAVSADDLARSAREESDDPADRRGLARAIAAQDGEQLAVGDFGRKVEYDMA